MNEQERTFKGIWIPKEIWLDKRLSCFEKMIYAEIDSLCGEEGCYASNRYLAEFFGCSERRIQQVLAELKKDGFITTVIPNPGGRRKIFVNYRSERNSVPPCKNLHAPMQELTPAPVETYTPISYNKDYNKEYNKDYISTTTTRASRESEKIEFFDGKSGLCLSDKQDMDLREKLSPDEYIGYTKRLDKYKREHPEKAGCSDYRLILKWAREDRQTEDDYLDKLKINTEEIKSAAAGCDYKSPDDFYDAGAAISAAEGWNAAIDEIKKGRQKEDK